MIQLKQYVKAESLDQAYELNQKKNNVIVGGMHWLKMSFANMGTAIDLSGLGLDQIVETEDSFEIGCMVTLRQIETHKGLNEYTKEVETLCREKGIDVILHSYPGRGDAVRLGIEQMMDLDGCLFCPCDQPFLQKRSIGRMVGKYTYGEKKMFRLAYGESQGAPVLFSREYSKNCVSFRKRAAALI